MGLQGIGFDGDVDPGGIGGIHRAHDLIAGGQAVGGQVAVLGDLTKVGGDHVGGDGLGLKGGVGEGQSVGGGGVAGARAVPVHPVLDLAVGGHVVDAGEDLVAAHGVQHVLGERVDLVTLAALGLEHGHGGRAHGGGGNLEHQGDVVALLLLGLGGIKAGEARHILQGAAHPDGGAAGGKGHILLHIVQGGNTIPADGGV